MKTPELVPECHTGAGLVVVNSLPSPQRNVRDAEDP